MEREGANQANQANQVKQVLQKPQGSWIFVGDGAKRAQTVQTLAYALHGHAEFDASCKLCRQLQAGNHPDVVVIRPSDKGSIGIDEVKTLQHTLSLSRHDSAMAYRIMIVDGADALTAQAQNALLKLLEEPPADAIILLLVSNETKLLDTVRSRCRVIYFAGVTATENDTQLLANELLTTTSFEQMVMAAKLDGNTDVTSLREALQERLRADLRQSADPSLQVRQMEALERFDRNLNNNVTPKAALTAFLLEAK